MRAVELKWLERVAYHEAGHAVAAFEQGVPFEEVTIIPEGGMSRHLRRGDFGRTFRPDARAGRGREQIEADIIVTFAGPAAEAKFGGRRNLVAARGDSASAAKLAAQVCTSHEEVVAYVEWLTIRAVKLIAGRPQWKAVQAVAASLLENHEISAVDARKIIKGASGPPVDATNTPAEVRRKRSYCSCRGRGWFTGHAEKCSGSR